ncbi:MAG: Uma2 family endonuclease [Saprospiraceae bacterium]|nr:Uma2 family endonuclease [Saprospiraceae bacterium]
MVAALRTSSPSIIIGKTKRMSLDRFRQWQPRDGWKYDWNDGETLKYKKMVSEKQRFIVQNLLDTFYALGLNKIGGLLPEAEMSYGNNRYRVPDVAFYTREQTKAAASGEHTIAKFIIEILSDYDYNLNIENKLWEYFENGVEVVWHIMPSHKLVKVYTSPRKVSILMEEEICSAKPALTDFEITVNQIFELKD